MARAVSGLWMLLYLGIVAAAPVADGYVDHNQEIVVHIEDGDGGDCPVSHDAEACSICQLAQGLRAVVVPASVQLALAPDAELVATGARGEAPDDLIFLDGRSPRAPPLG